MSSAPSLTRVPRSTGVATTRPATSAETSACSSAVSVPVAETKREIGFSTTGAVVALTVRTSLEPAALASLSMLGRQPAAVRTRRTRRMGKRIDCSSVAYAERDFANSPTTSRHAPHIAPDNVAQSDQDGDGAVDGPLPVIDHKAHRATREDGLIKGDVERLQNPHYAREREGQAQKSTHDTAKDVECAHSPSISSLKSGVGRSGHPRRLAASAVGA